MAVSLYFGLPGCGKTTLLSKLALDGLNDPRYQNVYVNIHLNIPGVTYIDNECIGKYEIADGLLLIDEASILLSFGVLTMSVSISQMRKNQLLKKSG